MKIRAQIKEDVSSYLFVLPALIFMLAFVGYPIVYNIILSMQNVNVMTFNDKINEFVWLQNYKVLFEQSDILLVIKNTVVYTVGCIIFQFVLGFVLALFFNMEFRLSKVLRGLVMVSWMIPVTISALIFKFMMSSNGGILDVILMNLHITSQPVEWLLHPGSAMWALIIANTWIGIPFNMILLITGLSSIPQEMYESSDIDGANSIQKFIFITLPSLKATISVILVLGFIYTFKVFDLVFVMTRGGPVNATEMLSTFSYKFSFNQYDFSMGAAVANILFAVLFVVSLGYVKLIETDEVM